jgi:purine-binding chemotaxis protein CheW
MPKDDSNNLLEPVAAVENYLDNLLQDEPPARPVLESGRKVVTLPGVRPLDELLAEPLAESLKQTDPVAVPGAEAEPAVVEQPEIPEPAVGAVAEPETTRAGSAEEVAAVEAPEPQREDPRDRYSFPVQCLMFRVDRHQLCIPLIDMGCVSPLDPGRLTRLPDTPAWLLGVLPHRERNLRIVDSAVLLGIERRQPLPERLHFLVFADADFAITCDDLGEVVYLQDDDIRWLAPGSDSLSMGTVRESLATLLSPGGISRHMARISTAGSKHSAPAADIAETEINEPNATE